MSESNEEETLFEFPCEFPIKALGKADVNLVEIVIEIIGKHVPDVDEKNISSKPSTGGNYISITVIITATSKAQLDSIYYEITDHPDILMAL